MEKISAVLITREEKGRVRGALESLGWADEIVVLDFQSRDRTAEICREYGARVHQEEWSGFVRGRNRLLELAAHPWVLTVDADERVEPELREEIHRALSSPDAAAVSGYLIPRKVIYLGRWIRHCGWWPDYTLRLVRRQEARWKGGEVHEWCEVPGAVRRLRSPLRHHPYDSLAHHLAKMNWYSDLHASQRFREGRNASFLDLLVSPPATFLKKYVFQLGFLDGMAGLTVCRLSAASVLLKKAKLRELHRRAAAGEGG